MDSKKLPEARRLKPLLEAEAVLGLGLARPWEVAAALQVMWAADGGSAPDFIDCLRRLADLPADVSARVHDEVARTLSTCSGDEATALSHIRLADAALLHWSLGARSGQDPTEEQRGAAAGALHVVRANRYVEFHPVGEGGMGLVYWALDTEMNRQVAFKIVRPDAGEPLRSDLPETPLSAVPPKPDTPASAAFEELRTRFMQEAWVTGGLEHPGVVPVYELGQTRQGVPYYTMRYVRGSRTLRQVLDATRGSAAADRLGLLEPFLKLCDTVRYAHSKGVIHRDLKPENVAVGEFGEVVLLDWGLAKLRGGPDRCTSRWQACAAATRDAVDLRTPPGAVGTVGYMSPEAALGRLDEVDERSDTYSLGAMLFEVLTGRVPHPCQSYADYLDVLASREPPDPREVAPELPDGLAMTCMRALERDRSVRTPSVAVLAREVRQWQAASALEREVEGLLGHARVSIDAAGVARGEARMRHLERASAALAQVEGKGGGGPQSAALRQRAQVLQAEAIGERVRAGYRRALQRAGVLALAIAAILATAVGLVVARKREEAEAARREAHARLLALFQERGREELLAGRPLRGVPLLLAALEQGRDSSELRTLLASAARDKKRQLARIELAGDLAGAHHQLSRDGATVVTLAGRTLTAWAVGTARPRWSVPDVEAYALDPGSRFVASLGWDAPLEIRSLTTGALIERLPPAGSAVHALAVAPSGLHVAGVASGARSGSEGDAVIWTLGSGAVPVRWSIPAEMVIDVVPAPVAGRFLLSTSAFEAWVWEMGASAPRGRIPLKSALGAWSGIPRLSWDASGERVIVEGRGAPTSVWDAATGLQVAGNGASIVGAVSPRADLVAGKEGVFTLPSGTLLWSDRRTVDAYHEDRAWSPDGRLLATADSRGVVRVWTARERMLLAELHGHETMLDFAGWSQDGRMLLTHGRDATLRAWDLSDLPTPDRIAPATEPVHTWGFDTRVGALLAVTASGAMYRWKLGTWERSRVAMERFPSDRRAQLSPDGHWLATWDQERLVVLSLDGSQGSHALLESKPPQASQPPPERDAPPPPPLVERIDFLPASRLMLSGSGHECRLWDVHSWVERNVLEGRLLAARDLAAGPRAVVSFEDGTVAVLRLPGGEISWKGAFSSVETADLSPDGRQLVVVHASSSSDASRITIVDLDSLAHARDLETLVPDTERISFSRDGTTILAQSPRRVLQGWFAASAGPAYTLMPPTDYCSGIVVTPEDDAGRCVVWWPGHALQLRSVQHGELLAEWPAWNFPEGALDEGSGAVMLSPDGQWLIVCEHRPEEGGARVRAWPVGPTREPASTLVTVLGEGASWALRETTLHPLRVPPEDPCAR